MGSSVQQGPLGRGWEKAEAGWSGACRAEVAPAPRGPVERGIGTPHPPPRQPQSRLKNGMSGPV